MRIVMCGDSVQGGRHADAPALRAALELLGRPETELVVHAGPLRTVQVTEAALSDLLAAQPDVVVLAHGGAEGILIRERLRGPDGLPALPPTAFAAATRRSPPLAAVRRAVRLSPPVASARRRLGGPIAPIVGWEAFAASYERTVRRLLEQSRATLVLMETCGSDSRHFPHEPDRVRRVSALVRRLGREHPDRVRTVDAKPVLARWEDFAGDRAHLRSSGHAKVARLLADALAASLAARDAPAG